MLFLSLSLAYIYMSIALHYLRLSCVAPRGGGRDALPDVVKR